MAYEIIKAKGRVSIFKGGEFDHQQFRGHRAYGDPAWYIAQLEAQDAEAAAERAEQREHRRAAALEYLAARAARPCHNQLVMEF